MRAVVIHGAWIAAAMLAGAASAKLPALSDEAKAKAAETAAKGAWTAKVDAYLLCKSQDKVAAKYIKVKNPKAAPAAAPACVDPGTFVYPPPAAGAVAAAAPPAKAAASAPNKS